MYSSYFEKRARREASSLLRDDGSEVAALSFSKLIFLVSARGQRVGKGETLFCMEAKEEEYEDEEEEFKSFFVITVTAILGARRRLGLLRVVLVIAAARGVYRVHAVGGAIFVIADFELVLAAGRRRLFAVLAVHPLLDGLASLLVLLQTLTEVQALGEVGLIVIVVGTATLTVFCYTLVTLCILGAGVEHHLTAQLGTDSVEFQATLPFGGHLGFS
ncbi:hypothetical protein EYF80_002037 [Liparis tanakae]|uniref:Uncharacterized protein n=1 Tax=Liparis tanakae TaxID=230148 RepID=A0A4Z2JC14_9TELE|nr:hypothetical protein EYF80_002037 [Liparis tanakae]